MKRYLKINKDDNVAVVLDEAGMRSGETAEFGDCVVTLVSDIVRGHKFALRDIVKGENIVKYGYPIGIATQDIRAGEWIHAHNLRTGLSDDLEYVYRPVGACVNPAADTVEVNGYLRKDGSMGIRNELWVVPTVGCVNGQANAIVSRIKEECDLSGIDDVRAFTHTYGCSQLGSDHANTRTALAALARHPNAGGVLVLGLGCENNQISALREAMGDYDHERVKFLVAQEVEDLSLIHI
mgnify:FL=1